METIDASTLSFFALTSHNQHDDSFILGGLYSNSYSDISFGVTFLSLIKDKMGGGGDLYMQQPSSSSSSSVILVRHNCPFVPQTIVILLIITAAPLHCPTMWTHCDNG